MRVFSTLREAGLEIRRDLFKSPEVSSTRVQQWTGMELKAHERLGMTYSILPEGWPEDVEGLIKLGQELELPPYVKSPDEVRAWLYLEADDRRWPGMHHGEEATELLHPALKKTIEGSWPSYTYRERLFGSAQILATTLSRQPDSRRAYWPIFQPQDALRAAAPTRVPCSLGYEALIRRVNDQNHLMLFYLQRSADFDTFWLSDLWLAHLYQENLINLLRYRSDNPQDVVLGQLVHHIISFHSFFESGEEIY